MTIPTESLNDYHTVKDGQTRMTIDVYKGERSRTKDNHHFGLFEITDLPPAPRGKIEVRISFKVDANGLLEVTAQNLATKTNRGIMIMPEDSRLNGGGGIDSGKQTNTTDGDSSPCSTTIPSSTIPVWSCACYPCR